MMYWVIPFIKGLIFIVCCYHSPPLWRGKGVGPPFLLYLKQHIVHATTGRSHGQHIVLFLHGTLQ